LWQSSRVAEWFSTLPEALQGVIIAQLGPLSLLVLGGIGWWIQHSLQARARERELTRKKLEQVLEVITTVDEWIEEQTKRRSLNKEFSVQSPASRAHNLISAYYPELLPQAKEFLPHRQSGHSRSSRRGN
jgi:hypothetical protein